MIPFTTDIESCDFLAGSLLLVDKPKGWTSFDVVNKLRWALRKKLGVKKVKVGHSGTLDPMATGLLLICTGKWTKRLHELQGLDKEYTGRITLGAETPSYDAETEISATYPTEGISRDAIENGMQKYTGSFDQVPPAFSAIKVKGQPLYKAARAGRQVEPEPRPVTVYSFDLEGLEMPHVEFRVACSKGTYIRSLAFDLGHTLGCGGYLSQLRRTRIGEYSIEDAWQLEELTAKLQNDVKPQTPV